MRISQKYGTTAHTPSSTTRNYVIDRWAYWSNQASKTSIQQVTDAPAGFKHSAKCTSLSAHTAAAGHWFGYITTIEAQDIYDLAQGTANAKSFTLSFYVKSSITGTWAAAIRTKPGSPSRSYPFNYTISSANTWERKTITIPGDTTGTWLTTNGTGIIINWGLALGSNWTGTAGSYVTSDKHGVTGQLNLLSSTDNEWLLTGVQLEVGTQATAFEHRTYGDELSLCQRYYQNINPRWTGWIVSATQIRAGIVFPTTMRATPSCTHSSSYIQYGPGGQQTGSLQSFSDISDSGCVAILNNGGGMPTNAGSTGAISMAASAEL